MSEYLEPRVAKLETGLEMLTRDVASLAQITRDQGGTIEKQLKDLAIGVTLAAAPRKTDWQTILAAIMLVMAIGSAVFWPLNQTAGNNKTALEALEAEYRNHTQLELHPVGKALLAKLQGELDTQVATIRHDNEIQIISWDGKFKLHDDMDRNEFKALDNKLQREFLLADKVLEQRQIAIEAQIATVNDKIGQRVSALEAVGNRQDAMDLLEVRAWRNKANGLNSPSSTVPLITKDIEGVPRVK